MKKRFISIILVVFLLMAYFSSFAYAAETTVSEQIIELENGYYLVITISEVPVRVSGTKTATKTYSCTTADGTVEWQAVLTGTFTYNSTSSTCTASSCDVTIYETDYYVVSKIAGKSGNTATGTVTMGRKFLGITIAQETYNMTLTCSPSGTLS